MKKKGFIIILLLFIPGLLFMNYIGVFTKVLVEEKMMGPYHMVFKEHKGEYKYTGSVIAEVFKGLTPKEVQHSRGFGLYYDDPKKMKKEDLKSDAGVISGLAFSDSLQGSFQQKEFQLQKCFVVEYPNKNFLSVYNGMAKVYPKLFKYAASKKCRKAPVMEIYEEKKITYLMPVIAE